MDNYRKELESTMSDKDWWEKQAKAKEETERRLKLNV